MNHHGWVLCTEGAQTAVATANLLTSSAVGGSRPTVVDF